MIVIIKIIENYNKEEAFLYDKTYLFIKGYATALNYTHTLKALPLARMFHNGQYRKGTIDINGKEYHLPYVLHVLKVCSTLISLDVNLSNNEKDELFATALLHDSIEDSNELESNDHDLVTKYQISESVYHRIKLLSKHPGSNNEELNTYFNEIKYDKLALLVKLADRSHNVEDLYNMKPEKLHKYVKETKTWIYPLTTYGKSHYPELSNAFTILKAKIVSLTEATETIVDMYEEIIKEKDKELGKLRSLNN